ncbi:L,D-transpeptidase [Rhizobium leguminosarum]|uniref:L,D-transpeptidase n=1 Tax=Rhizobium leguminosarum TaxID=384 RepID=UPI0013E2B432|nr:L,D-transpeptidase [Rhizobium leguminosarum]
MAKSFDATLDELENAKSSGNLVSAYENTLEPYVLQFGEEVEKDPSQARIEQWLRIYSVLSSLSIEGPSDITLTLYTSAQDNFERAMAKLSGDAAANAADFIESLKAPVLSMDDMAKATAAAFPITIAAAGLQTLAAFSAMEAVDAGHVKLYRGTLTVFDANKKVTGIYKANTGGFVADFRRKNGPTPPGLFKVSNYRPDRGNTPGMKREGVSFSFDLDERNPTGNRSAFRIHPDGPPPGTHGCVGVFEGADKLRECASKLNDVLKANGPFWLSVTYGKVDV